MSGKWSSKFSYSRLCKTTNQTLVPNSVFGHLFSSLNLKTKNSSIQLNWTWKYWKRQHS